MESANLCALPPFNRLYKTEAISRHGPWRKLEDVEYATSTPWTGSTSDGDRAGVISTQTDVRE